MWLKRLSERWKEAGQIVKNYQSEQQEILQIMTARNFQWDNYNKLVKWVNDDLSLLLQLEMASLFVWVAKAAHSCAFSGIPFSPSQSLVEEEFQNINDKNFKIVLDRVSRDSYKKAITLKVLSDLLKITSTAEFGDRHYKIWDIEINSFEDLQQNREELENLYNNTQNQEIPFLKEALEYADEKWIIVPIYS